MTAIQQKRKPAALSLPDNTSAGLPGAGNAWLDQLRADATAQYQSSGLPTVRDEEWRYTDLRAFKRQQYAIANSVPDVSDVIAALPDYDLPRVVLVNGYFAPACSRLDNLPTGISVDSLAITLQQNPESLKGLLGTALPAETHAFTQLNSAYCNDGAVIRIASKATVEKPIELIHVTTEHDEPVVSHPRNIIIADKLSQVTIIERSVCADNKPDSTSYLLNTVTEIIAHDGAQVQHYKVQQDADNAFHMGGVFANQGRDSNVVNHNITLGSKLARNDIHLNLLGTNAHGGMNGLVVGHEKQHVHNHTEVQHKVPHCTSDEYYRSVLDDKSRAVFRGRIVVAEDAQKTDAQQQNNNLLLSADAEADSKPQLEIYADDVLCSHGATVGQLDPKSLFYLQSRGINLKDAQRLLTFAFVNEVLERITFEPLQLELMERFLGELLSESYKHYYQELL
ncbi:MAG: Fe-S cluster assembly protein SufD [Arenicella sp.]